MKINTTGFMLSVIRRMYKQKEIIQYPTEKTSIPFVNNLQVQSVN